ncbi:MAG: MoaD/ThiS family protein [Candidatus Saccharicenans sp.]|nr:MoaD/ThiS family protein [Candidatus Saccharicenans sp.]
MPAQMIRVKIKFFAYFRELFGAREKELAVEKGATLAEILRRIAESPEQEKEIFSEGNIKPQVVIMINGSVVPAEALNTRRLDDHSVVAVFPMMGGG